MHHLVSAVEQTAPNQHLSFPVRQLGVWVDLDKSQLILAVISIILRIGCLELTEPRSCVCHQPSFRLAQNFLRMLGKDSKRGKGEIYKEF